MKVYLSVLLCAGVLHGCSTTNCMNPKEGGVFDTMCGLSGGYERSLQQDRDRLAAAKQQQQTARQQYDRLSAQHAQQQQQYAQLQQEMSRVDNQIAQLSRHISSLRQDTYALAQRKSAALQQLQQKNSQLAQVKQYASNPQNLSYCQRQVRQLEAEINLLWRQLGTE